MPSEEGRGTKRSRRVMRTEKEFARVKVIENNSTIATAEIATSMAGRNIIALTSPRKTEPKEIRFVDVDKLTTLFLTN